MGAIADLPGLYRAKETVKRILADDSPVQTVLLYGPPGCGSSELAGLLVKGWMCREPVDGEPCGECDSCRRIERGTAPDLLKAVPQPPSRVIRVSAVDGDSETGYPGIRPFLTFPPTAAKRKAVWIEEADRLNASAANALLKTLEEPPPYGRIVMTAPGPSSLLGTIVSRCLSVACELPREEDAAGIANEVVRVFAGRSPEAAALVLLKEEAYQGVLNLARRLPTSSPLEALANAEEVKRLAESLGGPDMPARQATADVVEALARALSTEWPAAVPAVIEAHRRLIGNGSAPAVLGALFAKLSLAAVPG